LPLALGTSFVLGDKWFKTSSALDKLNNELFGLTYLSKSRTKLGNSCRGIDSNFQLLSKIILKKEKSFCACVFPEGNYPNNEGRNALFYSLD